MRNERLVANAGSGKTHALTTRMIRLLAEGVEPRRIAALTFTRKSAGEFLSAVFERLAKAALLPDELERLRESTGIATLDATACRQMLARLSDQLGVLGMGTIDSLFARIARAFPLESGLAEDFSIAEEASLDAARERALAAVFARESKSSLAAFIDLLRRINRNHGERDVFNRLLKETKNLHAKFLATPQGVVWGDKAAIWGAAGCAILAAGPVTPAVNAFRSAVLATHPDFSPEALAILDTNLDLLRSLDAGASWNPEMSKFATLRLCAEPDSGSLRITPKKTGWLTLNPTIRSARTALLHAALKPAFETCLRRSESLHEFLTKFEAAYGSLVRAAGIVTFSDITDLLATKAADETWRTRVGYRIDQSFDHWLLDEFQDTSRPQWKILQSFLDEVLMDPEGGRSFFYVGDTKQAIYSWRGGDPDLFEEIFEKFNEHQATIHDAPPLVQSWRSCRPILDLVNKTFGSLDAIKEPLEIPEIVVEKWDRVWSEHIPSPATGKLKGYAEWVSVEKSDEDDDEAGDAVDQKILAILKAATPWTRGLSCAVLKRNNDGVGALASLLQANDIPVAVEGKTNPCVDNPLGASLIAALRVVASPDDTLSNDLLQSCPAAEAWGVGEIWKFRNATLAKLAESGYAPTLRDWITAAGLNGEAFLRERGADFLLAAEEFDSRRKSSDGILEFLRFVENRETQETEASGVVRVMTVHQSKGLGFDMVIAAGLDRAVRTSESTSLALGPSAKQVDWGVLLPTKDLAAQDSVFRTQLDLQTAERKYGELCVAYVALTRAKKALHVVTTKLGDNSKAKNFARHLSLCFPNPEEARFGDPDWFKAYAVTDSKPASQATQPAFTPPIRGAPKPVSPSAFKSTTSGGSGFTTLSTRAADLGTAVHEYLSQIEWFDSPQPDLGACPKDVAKLLREFLTGPLAAEVFQRPSGPVELWREQAFDVLLDGQWISGIFDRVVIHKSPEGKPVSAAVLDFKTDLGTDAEIESRYAGQMEVYRQSASRLLNLTSEKISTRMVSVRRVAQLEGFLNSGRGGFEHSENL